MRRWQMMQHVSYMNDILPCSDRCHETMTTNGAGFILKGYITMPWPLSWDDATDGAWLIPKGYIIMLWPLSWDDENWRSMFHTWMIYNHSLTVVMRRWQLMEHNLYQRYILPCSDRCLETMTTDGACFIPEEYITMLWPLSLADDNLQGMFNRYMIYNHALTVVMRWWQLTEHDSYMIDILPCSDRCHETMKTERACCKPMWWITKLFPLSWDDNNCLSMFHTWVIYYHALTVAIRWRQLTEHVSYLMDISSCSDCCHQTITHDGACFIP